MLHIHRAERADGLVEAVGGLLAEPPADPFAPELIAVPTRGMERWLAQRLAGLLGARAGRADGICANVEFPSPHRLLSGAVAAGAGLEPGGDPWLAERAVWPLLEVVDGSLGEEWLRSLSAHLGGPGEDADPIRRGRRLSVVRHLAGLYGRYALHRPEMLRAWAEGSDTDDAGGSLPEPAGWQAELWRRLRERIDEPSPPERLAAACERLRADPALVELPERLSLFGLTRLPAGHLEVLEALAAHRDVHLFLLHPSPELWAKIAGEIDGRPPPASRRDDQTAELAKNRLLASWGQDAREMQLVLAAAGEATEHHHPIEAREDTLLARIQADVRADRSPPGPPAPGTEDGRPELDPGDRSVQVHACHGRARQVEVVRDAILHELAADESLEPRDVIVMCPDIETFAPLIEATFGAPEVSRDELLEAPPAAERPTDLRVRLADRSVRRTNPLLGAVSELLALAGQRLTASQLLDLADREPVRRRFGFDDDELGRIQRWIAESGIRWGLDAAHRAPFKLADLQAGTWRAGLDRLLTGVAMTEEGQRLFEEILPLDDVEGGAIDLAGRLAELVARLQAALDSFADPQPIDAWAAAIATAADGLTATAEHEAWQRAQLERLLDDAVAEATHEGEISPTAIALPELRALLADRLAGRPTRANFRTGHLTICTLVPMRSVPHRIVCLLGLDDGAFPRKAPRDGDDLMLTDPRPGERDPRTEDRQLLLDALLAARDRLIVTYTGNDERTNAPYPPAVPLGELLDTVDATARTADGEPARSRVLVRHPLQPFDPRNFIPGELGGEAAWSFDRVALAGAESIGGERADPGPFLPAPLPTLAAEVIELDDLVRFVQHPVRAFLRQRLGIDLRSFEDEVADELPVELDGLGKWGVGDRLLGALLAGVEGRTAILAEIRRGTLPPRQLGEPVVHEIYPTAEALARAAGELAPNGGAAPASLDVRLELGDDRLGRSLGGTVAGLVGDCLRVVTYSRLAPKHRLAAWVRLLALCAARPERPFTAATIARAKADPKIAISRLDPPAAEAGARRAWALEQLATLLDLYDRGMREPLPLYCGTSAAYARALADDRDPEWPASKAWTSGWDYDKEDREPEHQLVLGGIRSFEALRAETARPDEQGEGWAPDEPSRLGRYARRLWDPLLACEEVEVR